MASLPDTLRRQLEKAVIAARDVAEAGARAALERLAVGRPEPFAEMSAEEQALRVQLRAHARQLADPRKESGEQEIEHLVAECAYEHWHRMLFARFLAENRLLIHPEHGVPVTLAECEELATEAGEKDGWRLAGRFAARMLPAIFRPDDPALRVRLAPEHQQALEKCLAELPVEVFTADDSLGWVYQFWQTKRKKEVNESGKKIGADELPAVTQLFTEPYMVQFLLHNTLGAWWAGKALAARPELAQRPASEEELRSACALSRCAWTYLRFIREEEGIPWRPAAGNFEGWPERAAEIAVLDPCCGSGHFLVEAFRILVPMRMSEERFSARQACDAVLRDNLFGLEIDERCTQIAAFNLALAAWTHPDAGGYRPLPELHIACSGLSVGAKEEEWIKLARKDERLREGMRRLYRLFKDAPTLGSLIDPQREFEAKSGEFEFDRGRFNELRPLLEQALQGKEVRRDAQATEAGIAAQGMARAATLLAGSYTLVATNVPYLGRKSHVDVLKTWADQHEKEAKNDLATMFVSRLLRFLATSEGGGTQAVVTPQNWLFLTSYKKLRERLLEEQTWNLVARLGPGAFETIGGHVVNVALITLSAGKPTAQSIMAGIDAAAARTPADKAMLLRGEAVTAPAPGSAAPDAAESDSDPEADTPPDPATPADGSVRLVPQAEQLKNPNFVIKLSEASRLAMFSDFALVRGGTTTGDSPRFRRSVWEINATDRRWAIQQSTVDTVVPFGGRHLCLLWENGRGELAKLTGGLGATIAGREVWRRDGVAISYTGSCFGTRYTGEVFENVICVCVPRATHHLPAIWAFCESPDFAKAVRANNQKLSVDVRYFEKAEFDFAHWQGVAAEKYPQGLPEPQSNDPTQWLFHGHPAGMMAAGPASASPFDIADPVGADQHPSLICRTPNPPAVLQVAVARLLGYRWPPEVDEAMRLDVGARAWVERCEELAGFADDDGIVCIPPVRGEQPAADRLQRLLARAFGEAWTPGMLLALLEHAGFQGNPLEDWLRDGFFEQHCQLFHQRPFVWHIWDGRRRDGFAALVNYHRLDRKLLERLAYTTLGDWIARHRQGVKAGERGAEDRLAAAEALQKKLALILEGEPPHDIFVRWKPVEQQPIGWEPDLNDGVRMNIRPFVEAGVLRRNPRINWNKDRGAEPESLRPPEQFPWFWKDSRFTGERMNDVHLANADKRAARERAAGARPC